MRERHFGQCFRGTCHKTPPVAADKDLSQNDGKLSPLAAFADSERSGA